MTYERWVLLDELVGKLDSFSDMPPEIIHVVAEHLEEAMSDGARTALQTLSEQLSVFFERAVRLAPLEAMNAAKGAMADDAPESAAYILGQLSFAQLFAAYTSERRIDDEFIALLDDRRYISYITALYRSDCTGQELSQLSVERVETVSRKLKHLRKLGITDFRREGTSLVNFLTPAARAILQERKALREDGPSLDYRSAVEELRDTVPDHLRGSMTFSSEPSLRVA